MPNIAIQSVQSLFIRLRVNDQELSTGTGFVVVQDEKPYLITNWHNLSGRNPETGQPLSRTGGIPDELMILHNSKNGLGHWVWKREKLLDNDVAKWIEHPIYGSKVDVVALPLNDLDGVTLYPHSIDPTDESRDFHVGPADTVSVIGFPFSLTGGGGLAIWATGFVASEPDIDYDSLPLFLIDCRGRSGQSGSAVLAYRGGNALVKRPNGSSAIMTGDISKFLGVYSGRINSESDLGKVWKRSAVRELFGNQKG